MKGGRIATIKSYKDKYHEHMTRNGMWGIFYFMEPNNKGKKWDLIINHSQFSLNDVKRHIKSLK